MSERDIAVLRVPPHSAEAEESILSAMLLDNEAIHRVRIEPEAFYSSFNRSTYTAILRLAVRGNPSTP